MDENARRFTYIKNFSNIFFGNNEKKLGRSTIEALPQVGYILQALLRTKAFICDLYKQLLLDRMLLMI